MASNTTQLEILPHQDNKRNLFEVNSIEDANLTDTVYLKVVEVFFIKHS